MNVGPNVAKVIVPLTQLGGQVSRAVQCEDGSARVETWGADGWEPGGADFAELAKGPPASAKLLAELGIPSDRSVATSLAKVSQDHDEIILDAAIIGLKKSLGCAETARSAPSTTSSQLSDERLTRAIARGFWLADLDALEKLKAKAVRFRTLSLV